MLGNLNSRLSTVILPRIELAKTDIGILGVAKNMVSDGEIKEMPCWGGVHGGSWGEERFRVRKAGCDGEGFRRV